MKRAYIYARTSTEKQQEADRFSIDSQIAQAKDFLKNYPEYELQETIIDAASAYSGSHLDAGLGTFLKQAETGAYEGDLLVIVYPDRLTRLDIDTAFNLLKRIALAKVNLAITSLNALIRHNDPLEFGLRMTLTSMFHLSHTDSKQKSDRIRKAYQIRTDKIRSGEKIVKTSKLPAWISVKDGEYIVDEAKAEIIRYIFAEKAKGVGAYTLAKRLTEMGAVTFTPKGNWRYSYIDILLRNVAVYGAYQVKSLSQ